MKDDPEDLDEKELLGKIQRSAKSIEAHLELIHYYAEELVDRPILDDEDQEKVENLIEQTENQMDEFDDDDGDGDFKVDDTLY